MYGSQKTHLSALFQSLIDATTEDLQSLCFLWATAGGAERAGQSDKILSLPFLAANHKQQLPLISNFLWYLAPQVILYQCVVEIKWDKKSRLLGTDTMPGT